MSKPHRIYAYSDDDRPHHWPDRPPKGWIVCPASRKNGEFLGDAPEMHYKPDDGDRCTTCGYDPRDKTDAIT